MSEGSGSVATIEWDISERERLDKELALARELALAVGAAETVDDAMDVTLQEICEATGWDYGEAWIQSDEEHMRCASSWHVPSKALEEFCRASTVATVELGVGLPGVAWITGHPVWMRDVASDPRFLRATLAVRNGLTAGMAMPVTSGEEVVAVLVFFVSEPREEDEHLIYVVSSVAAQLGSLVRRKQAEEALRRSEQQLRAIADTAVDAIISADSAGLITYVNRSAEEIFGYQQGELAGRPLTNLMPERFKAAHARGFEAFIETGETHAIGKRLELAGLHKNGSEFPVELALSTWTAGGEVYFTGVLRDITERRGTEEAMRQSDNLKTALLRSVSHDLRSPLTAIVAAGESSASPSLDSTARRELASVIVAEASRLGRLVDKLLDLSRLQGGAASPRQVSCSVEEIVHAALEHVRASDEAFELVLPPDLPAVRADATQLERAFANLFENAANHGAGQPVTVSAQGVDGRLEVSVSDRGKGVAEDDLERIFEPFYRAATSRGTHQGSGLGLAIVRGFVEANGGRVWVEPGAGSGATFVVELPAERAVVHGEEPEAHEEPRA